MAEAAPETPPEDENPQRGPWEEWVEDILEELKQEALKHFDPRLLTALGNFIYSRHGDTLAGARELIKILQRALFLHFRGGCQHSRIGQPGGGNPLSAIPPPGGM
ncbi:vpr protein [Human immunodeficiency virus 2]|uniref:Protein Vpr n=1 Tax=Human immunodeficiency virus 2 TaxID=11709 RepID=L8AZ65_9HIV2|nr:vpr protein [Human immunodeficiency virus 2]BAM76149.1 vpr protein [Human immunodeficiency virus 2]